MSKVYKLPNERDKSEYPDAHTHVVARTKSDYPVIAGRVCCAMMQGYWIQSEDARVDWADVLGWQYQNNDLLVEVKEPKTSRGYVLPEGWEPLDNLTLEMIEAQPLYVVFSFLRYEGWAEPAHSIFGRSTFTAYEILSQVQNLPWIAYRIAQPLERVEP